MHAPFDDLNRALFSLFVCGSLTDPISGLTFSLPIKKTWRFFIEIPYCGKPGMTTEENLDYLLPVLSAIAPSSIEIINNEEYQLHIGKEEELVARFLRAYSNGKIDRSHSLLRDAPLEFDELNDEDECRHYIYRCIEQYAPQERRNKLYEMSFTKFLYRRVQFFNSFFYVYNQRIPNLGSTAMAQMIQEAKSLSEISFHNDNYPRLYLVYDPEFSLHLLHNNWDEVPVGIKQIWRNADPLKRDEFVKKNYFLVCLSWLVGATYEACELIMNEINFILTENFTYKLLHIHERKLTTLPLIIEGDTGIGKTYLLKFYSLLLNANIQFNHDQAKFRMQILDRTSSWLSEAVIAKILEKQPILLNEVLQRLKSKLMGSDEENAKDDSVDFDHDYNDSDDDSDYNPKIANYYERAYQQNQFNTIAVEDEQENLFSKNEEEEISHHNENDENKKDCNTQMEIPVLPMELEQSSTHNMIYDERRMSMSDDQSRSMIMTSEQIHSIGSTERKLLDQCKTSLKKCEYDVDMLLYIWQTILSVTQKNSVFVTKQLLRNLREYIASELSSWPLAEVTASVNNLLENDYLSIRASMEILKEYLSHTCVKPMFYRLLVHPGVTEQELERFLAPIRQLAEKRADIKLVVFFDEVNTSSCLGLFKEIFVDRSFQGVNLPENIFFTAAINPAYDTGKQGDLIHRLDYVVHKLPKSLENLKIRYGSLDLKTLDDYITQKVAKFDLNFIIDAQQETLWQQKFKKAILAAQRFCEEKLGEHILLENLVDYSIIRTICLFRL